MKVFGRIFGVLLVFIVVAPVSAYHAFDVLGGTGMVSTNVMQRDYDSVAGTTKAETASRVAMREAIILGIRYSNYTPMGLGAFLLGAELNGMFARPSVSGDWKFTQYDSKSTVTSEALQAITPANAPSFNSVRGIFHIGLNIPTGSVLALEFGVMMGLGGSEAKYSYQSPYRLPLSTGASSGTSGIGVQGGLRFAAQLFPQSPLVVSFEYRLIADGFGSFLSFMPFIQSNSSLVSSTGHLFLLSVGYRFGVDSAAQRP